MPGTPFDNRVAVISGASAGIGEAVARHLAGAGARVVINARRADRLDEIVGELGAERSAPVAGDSADPMIVHRMLDTARDRFGAEADIVVVNAGRGLRGSVLDSNEDEWEEMIRTNLLGASRLMREAAKRLIERGPDPKTDDGWVDRPRDLVILGSNVGRHISPFSSMYGSTKFAVNSLAEALRRQRFEQHITIDLIDALTPRRVVRARQILINLVCATALAILCWRLWVYAVQTAEFGDVTEYLRLPRAPAVFYMSVFSGLGALVLFANALRYALGAARPVAQIMPPIAAPPPDEDR